MCEEDGDLKTEQRILFTEQRKKTSCRDLRERELSKR